MRGSKIRRLAGAAFVGGVVTVAGVGPLADVAAAGPRQDCAEMGGTVEHGGGPPRCVVVSNPNSGHTVVTTHQWSGGSFEPAQRCTYITATGQLNPSPEHSDEGCPPSI